MKNDHMVVISPGTNVCRNYSLISQEQLRPNLREMPLSSKIIPVFLVIFLTSFLPVNAAFSKVLLTNDGTRTHRISVRVSTTLSDFLK